MEKKSIGAFIAALRKVNGMTQKELAERLNVSDKTVSRWEREEGAPDLSVIPVLAEIFQVSCDELLRGERKAPGLRTETAADTESSPKGEKQRQRLLKSALSHYQNMSCIAMGISLVGMIAALICNLAFLKAVLGFLIGAIFFAVSLLCQAVFVNRAFLRVEDAGLEEAALSGYKRKVITLAQKAIGLTVFFLGFTFPMVLVDAYLGLAADSLLLQGAISGLVFLLIYAVILYFLNAALLKKGVYTLPEKEAARYHYNHKLKRRCFLVLLLLLVITFVIHQFATAIWGPHTIMDGIVFEDYASFIEYMEQDIPARPRYGANYSAAASAPAAPAPEAQLGETTYYDAYGNEISEEEALTRRLEDKNGNVVCEYIDRNESVISIRYTPKEGTILPITVFTEAELQAARQTAAVRHVIFGAVYCMECLAVALVYFRKRAR